jgi:hypothetical protein
MACLNWPLLVRSYSHSYTLFSFPPLAPFQMAARPSTSHSDRPTTSRGDFDPTADTYLDLTYSEEYSVEEDDESDDEDVFAFRPPPTAEQSPPPQPPSHSHITPLSHALPHEYPQFFPDNVPSPISPPPFSSFAEPLVYSPPTFISSTPTHNIPEAGPSTTSVHFVGKVDSPSPPSTTERCDSRSLSNEDGFRLRKLGNLPTSPSATSGFTSTSSQIPPDYKRRSTLLHEKRQTSTVLSDFSTTDPEIDSSSIKYVYHIPSYAH